MAGTKRAGAEHELAGAKHGLADAERVGAKRGSAGMKRGSAGMKRGSAGMKRGSAGVRQAGEERVGSWTGAVRVGVERDEATRRDSNALAAAAENPRARFLFVSGARVAVEPGAERVLAVSAESIDPEARRRAVYLGLAEGVPYFACDVGDADDSARDLRLVSRAIPAAARSAAVAAGVERARFDAAGSERAGSEGSGSGSTGSCSENVNSEHVGSERAGSENVRIEAAWRASADFASVPLTSHLWPSVEAELAVEAVAISNWIGGTRFCHRCGEPLTLRSGGWEMVCGRGHTIFPRVDPAVIMAIRDVEDRLLLARNGRWAPGRLSVLAGFVEAGEPLESAVAREVLEETGVVVDDVAYVTSQPWPFPRSLMLAFEGRTRARQEDVKVDGEELVFARFFSREEFSGALASGEIGLPTPTSVSARLIERWLGRPLVG